MLRQLSSLDPDEGFFGKAHSYQLFEAFRLAISVFSGVNREKRIYSAPYEPNDGPDTHYLRYYRSSPLFKLSSASGMPAFSFHDRNMAASGFEHSTDAVFEDELFVHEVFEVGKGVSLYNKQVADDRSNLLLNQPLWRGFETQEQRSNAKTVIKYQQLQPGVWDFWYNWYLSLIEGKPVAAKLQRRVALIADDIWEAGPKAVADEIERIQVRYLADQLPLAETIDLNPDTGKFRATPTPVENAPLMSALLTQISDDLEDAMAGHNGVTKTSSEARKIQRVVTRYGNDPQQAELTLTSVAQGLRRQLYETGELPDSEDNLALLNSVEEGVRGIRANHPEVAANREQLAQLAIQELSAEDRETLEKAAPVLSAISEGAMAEDFAEDIPELINDALLPLPSGAPRLPGADASTRVFGRSAKMRVKLGATSELTKKGAQVFDSDTIKTLRLIGFVGAGGAAVHHFVLKHLDSIVEIGLRVFGVL
ncbi:hypothetical protein [Shimia sp. R9_1]|uniref:hypothetical protein n=1 Tax=Shimia sp. R9_1 TaxID=2821111 RepID=UPI001FFE1146|nr:hypothetical protein [Shimia sp. R9_1]